MKRLIFLNSVSSGANLVVLIVTAFVMTPVIVRELGNRDYGIWEVALALVGYLSLLDLGIGPALIRLFAHARAREEHEEIERLFNTALVVLTTVGLLAMLLLLGLAIAPEGLLSLEPGANPELGLVLTILGVNLLARLPGSILIAYLQAVQRHYLMNGLRSALTVAQAVLSYLALTQWEGPKLVWLASIQLGVTVCELGIYAGLLLFREDELRFSPSRFSPATLRTLYWFGTRNLLALVSSRLRNQAMPLIIALVVGIERVVFFAIAQRVTEYSALLVSSLGGPLTPYFSDLEGRGDVQRIRQDWFRATRFLQFITCGLAIGIGFLGADFIAIWMGPDYAEGSRNIVRWLAFGLFLEGLAPPAIQLLLGMNRHGRAGFVLLAGAALSVSLSLPLGDRLGLDGVAAAYALGVGASAVGTMMLACSALGVRLRQHLSEGLLMLAPALAVETLLLVAVRQYFGAPADYLSLCGQGLLAGAAYTGSWWVVTLRESERDLLLDLTRGLIRRTP